MYILQRFTHDGLYKRAIKAEKEQPSHRFQMAFTRLSLRLLWKALLSVFSKLYPGMLISERQFHLLEIWINYERYTG